MEREGVSLKRNLDDKGLGQNKMLCSFSRVKLPPYKLPRAPPERQISGYLPAYGSRTTLTWIPAYYLSFIVSFGMLFSASCQSPLLLFGGELDYWSSHWYCNVDGRRSHCCLIRMVLVEQANEFSKMLDH